MYKFKFDNLDELYIEPWAKNRLSSKFHVTPSGPVGGPEVYFSITDFPINRTYITKHFLTLDASFDNIYQQYLKKDFMMQELLQNHTTLSKNCSF